MRASRLFFQLSAELAAQGAEPRRNRVKDGYTLWLVQWSNEFESDLV